MAIKIIDDKPHKSVVKKRICDNCGVTLEYTPNDVKTTTYQDYGGGSDSYDYITCPNCKRRIEV
jgi:hypothetical protein